MKSESSSAVLTASHLMRRQVSTLRKKSTLLEAVELTLREQVRHIPIVDKRDRVVGIVSDTDLRNAVGDLRGSVDRRRNRRRMADIRLGKLMSRKPALVGPDANLGEMASLMIERSVPALLVVDADEKLLGVVSDAELLGQLGPTPSDPRRHGRRHFSDGAGTAATE